MVNLKKNLRTFLTLFDSVFYPLILLRMTKSHIFSSSVRYYFYSPSLSNSFIISNWKILVAFYICPGEREKKRIPTCHLFSAKQTSSGEKHRGKHWHCLHKPQGESRLNSGSRSSDSLTLAWHDVQLWFRNSRCTWTPVLFQRQVSPPSSLN